MTTGVYGADVEQLRSLAKKFEASGESLLNAIRALDHQVNSAGAWHGPDAERFRSDWNGRDKAAITRSAEALRDGASALARNAEEQKGASAAAGGSIGGSAFASGAVSAAASAISGTAATNMDERALIEAYHNLRQLQAGGLTVSDEALLAGKLIGGHVLEKVGLVADGADLVDAVSNGNWWDAANILSKNAGDTIKSSVPGPVGYLSGTAIDVWSDVINQASKADWSEENRLQVVDYATQHPWDALDAAVGAEMNFLPTLVGDVLPGNFRLFHP